MEGFPDYNFLEILPCIDFSIRYRIDSIGFVSKRRGPEYLITSLIFSRFSSSKQ